MDGYTHALAEHRDVLLRQISQIDEQIKADKSGSLVSRLRLWYSLKKFKAELEKQAKSVGAEMAVIESKATESILLNGMDAVKVDGVTFSPQADLYASPIAPEAQEEGDEEEARNVVAEALVESGYQRLVKQTYHHGQLRALLKEIIRIGREKFTEEERVEEGPSDHLPEPLRRAVRVTEVWKLSARK